MFDHVKVAQNFTEGLMVQLRVLYALMLRETKTVFGRSKFGYMWVIFQTAFNVLFILGIRTFMGADRVSGLPLSVFLICGFAGWGLFSETASKVMVAVDANKSLLYFSKVRHWDLAFARTLLLGTTNFVVMVLLMLMTVLLGEKVTVYSLWPLLFSYSLLLLMGLGLGLFFCALKRYSDSVSVFVSIFLRIGIFTSGTMFSLSVLPPGFEFLIHWNPVLQLIEYSRATFSYAYPGESSLNLSFVSISTLSILVVGMAFELFTRNKTDVI